MKRKFNINILVFGLLVLPIISCTSTKTSNNNLAYNIDLNDREDDLFKVELLNPNLSKLDTIYQFAATAPGTYQVMDIGRYVQTFTAFDKHGNQLFTERKSKNQFRLDKPKKIALIKYEVSEVWDSPIKVNVPWAMASTSIEDDHVLLNSHCVIGYPINQQSSPIELNLNYPAEWKVGTPLKETSDGVFYANNYDHLIDSPILLGRLSYASTILNNTTIDIYTYSKTDKIKSDDLMNNMLDMLNAADKFLVKFPVDRYTFLFHFEDKNAGAWEHSYSSEYVLPEYPLTPQYAMGIKSIASHEFFHIITPLNIHSEIIEEFNFTNPVPSKHLWLYEGVTEWASDMMRFRGGLIGLKELLNEFHTKLLINDGYDQSYSLEKLALTSFTDEGFAQYSNIYAKGAMIATLLDIRLLELSNGQKGLREVINELTQKYGKKKAFSEDTFYEDFANMTYPEVTDFFNKYVKGKSPLPLKEYFKKIGINYNQEITSDTLQNNISINRKHHFEINHEASPEEINLRTIWSVNL